MILVCVFLFLISTIFFVKKSIRTYRDSFNPIVLVSVLFFLNNWSLSFSNILYPNYSPYFFECDIKPSQHVVLLYNLVGYVAFCVVFFLVSGVKTLNGQTSRYKFNSDTRTTYRFFLFLYILFLLLSIYNSLSTSHATAYGQNQALTGAEAFNPFAILLSARTIFAVVLLVTNKGKAWKIILIELFLGILSGGRKSFIIVFVAAVLSHSKYKSFKFRTKHVLTALVVSIAIGYFSFFMMEFRLLERGIPLSKRVEIVNDKLQVNGMQAFFTIINSSNSETVQNWMYQLIEKKELNHTYGLTYVQAILNTVVLRPFQGELVNYQAAYYFKRVAYPYVDNMGYDFSFSAESYLNFGWLGIVSYVTLAFFLGTLYKRQDISLFSRILLILTLSTLAICFRTDSTSFFRYLSFFILPYILIYKAVIRRTFITNQKNETLTN